MTGTFRITLLAAFCSAACACQPASDDAATVPSADAGRAADAMEPGSAGPAADFTCDDGSSVRIDRGAGNVVVTWADGRTLTVPKAESASAPGADAYVGDTVSVEHSGDQVVLREAGKAAVTCAAGGGSAAATNDATITMRYACEPDTQVTVFSDDSARVALPDGQSVTMRRIAGSEPPTFTGGSLYFAIGETDARLSQGDQANELVCKPA